MKFLKGDILYAKHGIICQLVNCQLLVKNEFTKKIVEKYPVVKSEYKNIEKLIPIEKRLGRCQVVEVLKNNLYVANLFSMFAAEDHGEIDYGAFSVSIATLKEWHLQRCNPKFPIYFPYMFNCEKQKCDWEKIKEIISNHIPDALIIRGKGDK